VTAVTDDAFRSQVRTWFADNPPAPPLGHSDGRKDDYDADAIAQQRQWMKRLSEAGLSGIAWPTEYGGRGATPLQQIIFHEEHQRAGGRGGELFFVGVSHAGPTLIEHGTDAQRRRWLPGILNGDILVAQCFSEPGAGSDLASITTRATVDADALVITGEKRWSTHAQHADLCELLVRTDPADRYGGLTYLIADLRSPGVSVRPIRTITGAAEFSEVFFDGARVPVANVVGGIGAGWTVATTTLRYERSTAFAAKIISLQRVIAELASEHAGDPARAQQLSELSDDAYAARALLYKCVAEQDATGRPSPASAALKLIATELNHRVLRCAAMASDDGLLDYLESFGLRIGGGTSEIQRNIIAERLLGLPREPKAPAAQR
jgi:alkylation response protein AidB-like acyl-CoA dehydrogenase